MIEMTRLVGWAAWTVLMLFMTPAMAPIVEGTFFPIRVDQSIADVVRGPIVVRGVTHGDTLCWTWTSTKRIARVSDGMDASLAASGRRFDTSVYSPVTGDPWNGSQALPVEPHPQHQRYCVDIPPSVPQGADIRVTQDARYPGVLGHLWHVILHVPDVVFPP